MKIDIKAIAMCFVLIAMLAGCDLFKQSGKLYLPDPEGTMTAEPEAVIPQPEVLAETSEQEIPPEPLDQETLLIDSATDAVADVIDKTSDDKDETQIATTIIDSERAKELLEMADEAVLSEINLAAVDAVDESVGTVVRQDKDGAIEVVVIAKSDAEVKEAEEAILRRVDALKEKDNEEVISFDDSAVGLTASDASYEQKEAIKIAMDDASAKMTEETVERKDVGAIKVVVSGNDAIDVAEKMIDKQKIDQLKSTTDAEKIDLTIAIDKNENNAAIVKIEINDKITQDAKINEEITYDLNKIEEKANFKMNVLSVFKEIDGDKAVAKQDAEGMTDEEYEKLKQDMDTLKQDMDALKKELDEALVTGDADRATAIEQDLQALEDKANDINKRLVDAGYEAIAI